MMPKETWSGRRSRGLMRDSSSVRKPSSFCSIYWMHSRPYFSRRNTEWEQCLVLFVLFCLFLRQGFSVVPAVLELAVVYQAGLELRGDPPSSVSLKACATAGLEQCVKFYLDSIHLLLLREILHNMLWYHFRDITWREDEYVKCDNSFYESWRKRE